MEGNSNYIYTVSLQNHLSKSAWVFYFSFYFFGLQCSSSCWFGLLNVSPQRHIAGIGSKSTVLGPSIPIHNKLFRCFSPNEALASILTLFIKKNSLSTFAFHTGSAKRSSAIKITKLDCDEGFFTSTWHHIIL